jgi:four helix bundle protein
MFGMTSQIRRASQSISANIAEGWGRGTTGDYIQFLRIARGSARELETHLLMCVRVGMLTESDAARSLVMIEEICRMLATLISKLIEKRNASTSR